MKKRTSFVKFIRLWGFIFLLAIGLSIIAVDITASYRDFHHQAELIRNDFISRQKEMVKQEVTQVVALIVHGQAQSEAITKAEIKSRVYEAYAIADHIYQQNRNTRSTTEIKQLIIDALRPIRFAGGSGYYFATHLDGVEVLFADKPELEGLNLMDMQDPTGKLVIKDMIDLVQQSGEGFYEYCWSKPDQTGNNYNKIAFVKLFDPLNCLIGTGLYVVEVETKIKTELLDTISRIRFAKEGYIFVNRLNGDALVSNGECFSGTEKLWQVFNKNPEKMKDIFEKEMIAAAKPEGDFIYYSWIKLSDPNQESPKTSFVFGLPELQWLVGAGVYLDDIETDIALLHSELNHQVRIKVITSTVIAVALAALFLFFFKRWNIKIEKDFRLFSSFFNRAAVSDEAINRDNINFIELDRLAEDANLMLKDKVRARQELMDEREALLESEKKYREMANLLPQIVYELDLEGNLTFLNDQAYVMSGYSVDDFNTGINILQLMIPEDRARAQNNIERILAGNKSENFDYTALRKDGGTYSVLSYSSPIIRDGKTIGLRGIAVDTTERKKLEEELQKAQKLESVGVLAGGLAHDFNNILTAILGNVSLALTLSDSPKEAHELLIQSQKAALRAKDLTQQLLTFAKGGEPVRKIAAIDEVIRDSAGFVLRGSKVRCEFNFSEGLLPVAIDTGQISQVIQNIVINSSQAMPNGGLIEIECSNFHLDQNDIIPISAGDYIKVVITDQGIGVPADQLDKIFDPYFSTKQNGNGLGLAITHSIVIKHFGYITVDSSPGHGTSISIYLPASKEKSQIIPDQPSPPHTVTHSKIMIMDDDEMIIDLVKSMLSRLGYEVVSVSDGEEALNNYLEAQKSNSPIDLIIMDLTIPGGVSGQEAVKSILAIDSQAKVIVSSGYANDPVMADFGKYGFCDALAKPFQFQDLTDIIEKALVS